jgi:hypothetical protein
MLFDQPPAIDLPADCGDPTEAVVAMLMNVGLDEASARRLVEEELTFTPSFRIPLLTLAITSVEQRVAEKLRRYSLDLTDEERDVLIVVPIVRAEAREPGFRERALDYCGSEAVAQRMFAEVFKPQPQFRGCIVRESPPLLLLPGPSCSP